jgi:hypothetical protein
MPFLLWLARGDLEAFLFECFLGFVMTDILLQAEYWSLNRKIDFIALRSPVSHFQLYDTTRRFCVNLKNGL